MPSSTSSSDHGITRLARDAVLTLLVAACIEVLIGLVALPLTDDLAQERFYPPDRVPTFTESILQWQVHHAGRLVEHQDLLVVGDSSGLMGVRPEDLMKELGGRAWSLCTIGYVGTTGQVRVLRHYLARHAAPRVVVFHCSVPSLTTTEAGWREKSTEFDRFGAWIDRLEGRRPWLPSLDLRPRFRRIVSGALDGEVLRRPRGPYGSDQDVEAELWRRRGATTEAIRDPWPRRIDLEGGLTALSAAGLGELFELAREHGILVLVVLAPLPSPADTPATRATLAELERDVQALAEGASGIKFAVPFVRWYPAELCARLNHLNERGASRNSHEIAEQLRDLGWAGHDAARLADAPAGPE